MESSQLERVALEDQAKEDPSTLFGAAQLNHLAALAGFGHRITSAAADGSLLKGQFRLEHARPGLQLHTVDACETQDGEMSITLPPRLGLCVLLEGDLEFSVDQKNVVVEAPQAFAINLCRPARLKRRLREGKRIAKVNISVDHDWLSAVLHPSRDSDRNILRFIEQHRAVPVFAASPALATTARAILNEHNHAKDFQSIALESLLLTFIGQALARLSETLSDKLSDASSDVCSGKRKIINDHIQSVPRSCMDAKGRKLKSYLEHCMGAGDARTFTLRALAREMGMSVSTLQRLAKRELGQPLLEYLRQRRLTMARDAIAKDGISIGEAAYLAGYKHVPNFSAAFKRAFGVPPGAL